MAEASTPKPVMYFAGFLSADTSLFDAAASALAESLGPVGLVSDVFDFDFTSYYEEESGANLKRSFYAFKTLGDPARLASIKLFTNSLEKRFAKDSPLPRPVNIDPGYITQAKLILASAKDFAHRVYLGEGIYAEVTLNWRNGAWRANPWTYPDYQTEAYRNYFAQLRTQLCRELAKRNAAREREKP